MRNVTPTDSGKDHENNNHRRMGGGQMAATNSVAAPAALYWVKLMWSNNVMRAYGATNRTDGTAGPWTQVNTNVTMTLTNPIHIGGAGGDERDDGKHKHGQVRQREHYSAVGKRMLEVDATS